MRVGLLVDSACDLPYSFMRDNNVFILPISVRIDDQVIVDDHDYDRTLQFYESGLGAKGHDAESIPYSVEQIRDLFLTEVVVGYDFAFCETITRSRSPIYDHAAEASHAILREYRARRQAAGVDGPFSMRVVNSGTLFSGQGVLAAHTLHLIRAGIPRNELRQKVQDMTGCIYAYAVPPDVYYIRERARKKGDDSIGWFGAVLGRALEITPIVCGREDRTFPVAKVRGFEAAVERLFDYACGRIEKGLLSPYMCISYAGDPAVVEGLPGFPRLRETAQAHGVELMVSIMSITGGVNVGPGTVTLGFAAEPHEFG